MDVVYRDAWPELPAAALAGFCADWRVPPSAEAVRRVLAGSAVAVLAQDGTTGEVVGFVTALSDGVLNAHVTLIEVRPAWRGRGIGSLLRPRPCGTMRSKESARR